MYLIFAIVVVSYAVGTLAIAVGIRRVVTGGPTSPATPDATPTSVCIIVAARNEAAYVDALMSSLVNQEDPGVPWQVLFIDDHSTDQTKDLAHAWQSRMPQLQVLTPPRPPSQLMGKLNALAFAVDVSTADLIVLTDGNTRVAPQWLRDHVMSYQTPKVGMVVGTVLPPPSPPGWRARFEALLDLIAAAQTAGTVGLRRPSFCSASNLSFRRAALTSVGGYPEMAKQGTGDDTLLLQAIGSAGWDVIHTPLRDANAVTTNTSASWHALWKQRVRHLSSLRVHSLTEGLAALLLRSIDLLLIGSLLGWFWSDPSWLPWAVWGTKATLDYSALRTFAGPVGYPIRVHEVVAVQPLYAIWIWATSLAGLLYHPSWKRTYDDA